MSDDIRINLEITNNSNLLIFQKNIDDVENWALTWQLKLTVTKCQHIHISLSKDRQSYVGLPHMLL